MERITMPKEVTPYLRTAKYYETDQMGIIHHANYIKWFEEARVDLLEQIGFGYDRLEESGIISPVLSVSCEYKSSVKFNDTVKILTQLVFFNGTKMTVRYEVLDAKTDKVRATGESKHCFLAKDTFRPIKMKHNFKDIYELLLSYSLSHS